MALRVASKARGEPQSSRPPSWSVLGSAPPIWIPALPPGAPCQGASALGLPLRVCPHMSRFAHANISGFVPSVGRADMFWGSPGVRA